VLAPRSFRGRGEVTASARRAHGALIARSFAVIARSFGNAGGVDDRAAREHHDAMSSEISDPPDDFWEASFVFSPPTPVRVVSAAAGLVIAAGDALHMLRPGDPRLRSRPLPPEHPVAAVAAEPWSPFRLAIASRGHLGIYTGQQPDESIIEAQFASPEVDATHLAWARHNGETMLYFRQANGEVGRLRPEAEAVEAIACANMAAIAADASGSMAMISILPPDEAEVSITPDGKTWDERCMVIIPVDGDGDGEEGDPDEKEDEGMHVHLAISGSAVAYSIADWGAYVSWKKNTDDETKDFESPPGVFWGPIALQGDQGIFAAYNVEGQVRILHHIRNGGATRIARFGVGEDWEGVPATVTGLAWDEERRVLWAASPELGLIKLTEPGWAQGAKGVLN
jgi:hypothetical protein